LLARSLVLLDDRQKLFGNQLEAVFSFSTGSVGHTLLAGFEVSRLGDRFTQDVAFLPPIDVFDPVETAQEPLFILPGLSQVGDSRSLVFAPYVVDRMSLSERVQFFVGGRLDITDFEDPATSTARSATKCNPLFGVVVAPKAGLSLYANAGTSFAPPSSQVVGEREPEQSVQVEVGAKKTFLSGRALATLAFYHLAKDNIAIPDATGFTRQNGDARSRGLEVELSAEATKGWFTYFTYGFNDAELTRFNELALVSFVPPTFALLDRSGNDPAFTPRHILNLWTTKEFESGLSLAAGARYVSRQFIAEENAFAIDDYLVLDAMIAFKRGRWRGSLNLKNLTDRDYETRGFSSTSVLPADPFTVQGRIEVSLGSR
jgi:iron complex outermembrane receptor protein